MYTYDSERIGKKLSELREEWKENRKRERREQKSNDRKKKALEGKTDSWSDSAFAEFVGVNNRQSILDYESGTTAVPFEILINYCNVFDCDLEYILGEQTCKRKESQTFCDVTKLTEKSADNFIEYSSVQPDVINQLLSSDKFGWLMVEIFDYSHSHFTEITISDSVLNRTDTVTGARARSYIKQRALDVFSSMLDDLLESFNGQAEIEAVQSLLDTVLDGVTSTKQEYGDVGKEVVLDYILNSFSNLNKDYPHLTDKLIPSIKTKEEAEQFYNQAELISQVRSLLRKNNHETAEANKPDNY